MRPVRTAWLVGLNLGAALAYWGLSWANWQLFHSGGVLPMPLWPAAGLAVALATRLGWRIAPALWLGTLLANHHPLGASWTLAALVGVLNAVGPVVATAPLRRRRADPFACQSLRDVGAFLGWGVVVMAALTATGGIGARLALGDLAPAAAPLAWLRWWLAHASGAVLVAPLLLSSLHRAGSQGRGLEYTAVAAATLAFAALTFLVPAPGWMPLQQGLPFVLIAPLAWVATRHSLFRTVGLFSAVVLMGMVGTVLGLSSPFGGSWPLAVFGAMALAYSVALLILAGVRLDQLRAAADLKESEARLRALGDNLPNGLVYSVDTGTDGLARRFTYLSAGVQALHGATAAQVMADPTLIYRQFEAESAGRIAVLEQQAIATMTPFHAEARLVLPSGEARWRLFASAPRRLSDGHLVWEGVEVDITEHKRADAEREQLQAQLVQAQKMESVGRLAGGVAHDFNNMLTVILGQTEFAQAALPADHPVQASLATVLDAGRRSADLTAQLLAFARKQTIAPRVLDLNAWVGETVRMLRRLIGEDVELSWSPGAGAGSVKADPSQLHQVLANLCVNARDAIRGVGRIAIETRRATLSPEACSEQPGVVPGEYVVLAVTDTGCGMGPETLRHLFEPFFTTKELGRGTGLGLATVYGIVQQNGGFVRVSSELGRGSRFEIHLPRVEDAAEAPASAAAHAPRGHETILLVEDEPAILEVTRRMLERGGYRVLAAGTAEEALRLARAPDTHPDLLLSDVVMPTRNGHDLAQELRALHPGMRLLFMSGYPSDAIAHHGVLEADVAFLQKPFSMAELHRRVRQVLEASGPALE